MFFDFFEFVQLTSTYYCVYFEEDKLHYLYLFLTILVSFFVILGTWVFSRRRGPETQRVKPSVQDFGFQTDPSRTANYYGVVYSAGGHRQHGGNKLVYPNKAAQKLEAEEGVKRYPPQHIDLSPEFYSEDYQYFLV